MLKKLKSNALKSKHIQTFPLNLSKRKKLKSHIFTQNIYSSRKQNKKKKTKNAYNNLMRPWTPPTFWSSKAPTPQDPLRNLKAMWMFFISVLVIIFAHKTTCAQFGKHWPPLHWLWRWKMFTIWMRLIFFTLPNQTKH